MLRAQAALVGRDLRQAGEALNRARRVSVVEPEPRQDLLLTEVWFALEHDDFSKAHDKLTAASAVFKHPHVAGDHTMQLLARFSRFKWPETARAELEAWRAAITDKQRRMKE